MNKELFASMREQMKPGEEVRAALAEKLSAPQKRRVPAERYAAVAACAAVIVAAVPVYGAVRGYLTGRVVSIDPGRNCIVEITEPHSYVLADEVGCWPEDNTVTENSTDTGAGDQDQDMTAGELADNMLEAGFTQEDVDGYLASGWQMTWARWWKFYHLAEASGEWTLEALLAFSQAEGLAVNTGEAPEMPGGAFAGDAPDQGEAVAAYQNLLARFEADYGPGRYPEWYGGAYIDEHGGLVVNIVERLEPEGKELFWQIQDWAGTDRVAFGSSTLSLDQLRELQDRVLAVMDELGLSAGCGINEEMGRVELTLEEVNNAALWMLAELDPAGTAILVIVARSAALDAPAEEPAAAAPSVSHTIQPGGTQKVPDDAIADENGVIAWEPQS